MKLFLIIYLFIYLRERENRGKPAIPFLCPFENPFFSPFPQDIFWAHFPFFNQQNHLTI